ncbi:MAG: M48 family metalloprotease [Candidatus Xenobia bacterium]
MKKRALLLVTLLAVMVLALPVQAQYGGVDQFLAAQDSQVLSNFSGRFARDQRYDTLFARIYARLNPHLSEVYSDPDKDVRPYCFVSTMGFNAMTWDHIIVFDSLLLDSLRRLSEGVVVYGKVNTPYGWSLARAVASLQRHAHSLPQYANPDHQDNIYDLPVAGQLTPEQRQQADALFEEMVASWLAHEGSHAFLNHARLRVEEQQMRQMNASAQGNPQAFGNYIDRYREASLGQEKEREADEHGAQLILRSGYTIRGFVLSLQFSDMLEQLMGTTNSYLRTHPPASERIADIERIAGSMPKP